MATRGPLRFICDEQLGRLAKWLRLQGFDTVFKCPISDAELIHVAQSQERVLLTRDRQLEAKTLWDSVVLIEETHYPKQLNELGRKIRLPKGATFSRCLRCNEPIRAISKGEIKNQVPEEVFHTYDSFYTCPSCHKIFWRGSHVKNTEARLRQMSGLKGLRSNV